jgi:butyrate kinase
MASKANSISKLEAVERETALRFKHIEERLEKGHARFNKLDAMVWGLYGLLVASIGIDKLL